MAHQTVRAVEWDPELVPTADGRTVRPSEQCPVEVALAAIGGRWTTLILRDLAVADGPVSYSALADGLPELSDKVLVERLARLTTDGYVNRESTVGYPTRVHYRISARGRLLRPLLIELYRTGTVLKETDRPDSHGFEGASVSDEVGAGEV